MQSKNHAVQRFANINQIKEGNTTNTNSAKRGRGIGLNKKLNESFYNYTDIKTQRSLNAPNLALKMVN